MIEIGELVGKNEMLWLLIKGFYLLAFGVYLIFSVIVWRQINLMAKTLKGTMVWPLKMLGGLVFALALGGLVVAIIVL